MWGSPLAYKTPAERETCVSEVGMTEELKEAHWAWYLIMALWGFAIDQEAEYLTLLGNRLRSVQLMICKQTHTQ
jgi:hypothetical protein